MARRKLAPRWRQSGAQPYSTALDALIAGTSGNVLGVAVGGTGIASYTAGNYLRALNASTLEQRTPAQVAADIGLASGTYTPTLTNEANVVASTATPFYFLRVGDVVSGGGRVTIAPAAASTQSFLQISLPIHSDFANAGDCSGTGAAHLSASLCGGIQAEPTANTARLSWVTTADVANRGWSVHFIYRIF